MTHPEQGPAQDPAPVDDAGARERARRDAVRRRRRAAAFGETLPDSTGDERGAPWGEPSEPESSSDEWLRRQVPPHHG